MLTRVYPNYIILANLVSRTSRGTNKSLEIAIQAELARSLKVTTFNSAPAIITGPAQLTLGLERHRQRHIRELSSSIMEMQYPAAHNFIVGDDGRAAFRSRRTAGVRVGRGDLVESHRASP